MATKSTNVAIIGLGAFGSAVARELSEMGDRVLGIDSDGALVARFADELDAVLEADASDVKSLSQCSLDTYDAVIVSIGENTEASILAAMNVVELGCERVWVKAQSDTHRKILEAIGIRNVVQPERAHGERVAQIVHNQKLLDYLTLNDGFYVANVAIPKRYIGKKRVPAELGDSHAITCLGICRGANLISGANTEEFELMQGDSMLLYGKTRDLRRFADS